MRRIYFSWRIAIIFFLRHSTILHEVHFDTYHVFIVNHTLIVIVIVVCLIVSYNICNYSAYFICRNVKHYSM